MPTRVLVVIVGLVVVAAAAAAAAAVPDSERVGLSFHELFYPK